MAKRRKPADGNADPRTTEVACIVASAPKGTAPPYLVVTVKAEITEATMVSVFEAISNEVKRQELRRVLVDLRQSTITLTISDMLGVAKMTAAVFTGVLQRLAMLVQPQLLRSEKFFEPSVSSRGVPTFVSADVAEAEYWITSKTKTSF